MVFIPKYTHSSVYPLLYIYKLPNIHTPTHNCKDSSIHHLIHKYTYSLLKKHAFSSTIIHHLLYTFYLTHTSKHPPIHKYTQSSIHPPIHKYTHSSIHPPIHKYTHSSRHPLTGLRYLPNLHNQFICTVCTASCRM